MAENHTIKEIIERVKKNKRWPDVKIISYGRRELERISKKLM